MKLKAKYLGIETGGRLIAILNEHDAEELGVLGGERIRVKNDGNEVTTIVNIEKKSDKSYIGTSNKLWSALKLSENSIVEVLPSPPPESLGSIQDKIMGRRLSYEEIYEIVKDVSEGNISEIETTGFITALHAQGGPTMDEAFSLTVAMVNIGKQLKLDKKPICDKHSIGGMPGDKTSLLLVPIVAAAGLIIPKTSSRAITSAAGTADRAETFMPVSLEIEDMKRVVESTNGCLVWGGALDLAPADDVFIKVEYPLSIDPMLLPSIMSKKKSVGANYLVIDIPTGRGTKMKTIGSSDSLSKEFIQLGKRLGIKTQCILTHGDQPLGYSIGAGLEAREALDILVNKKTNSDVADKVSHIAGTLFEMNGMKNGQKIVMDIIKSGKAEEKLREIIYQQGGDSEIKPEDIEIGKHGIDFKSNKKGSVLWIDNRTIMAAARAAGSPKNKKSGIILRKKLGDIVEKGDTLYTLYSDKTNKLRDAEKIIAENNPFGVDDKREMLIHSVKDVPKTRHRFILER